MMLFLFVLMLVGVDSSDSLVETLRGQRVSAIVIGVGFGLLLIGGLGNASISGFTGALFWLAALIGPDVTYGSMVPALLMAGIGMGLTFAPSSTAVLVDMDEPDHGTASSTNSTLREIGVALGIAVLTAVFLAAGHAQTDRAHLGIGFGTELGGARAEHLGRGAEFYVHLHTHHRLVLGQYFVVIEDVGRIDSSHGDQFMRLRLSRRMRLPPRSAPWAPS